jgi:hypothetical protein
VNERLRLSVVMAAPAGSAEPDSARLAFEAQLEPARGDELIVERGEATRVLVPELWTRGILRSSGDILALTLASMVPDPNWANVVRGSFDGTLAGVGGAIEPAAVMRSLDWAIHLTRYSGYLLPFSARDVDDLPGDNAAYLRSAIDPVREAWAGGFWETAVDRALRRSGQRLRPIPTRPISRNGNGARTSAPGAMAARGLLSGGAVRSASPHRQARIRARKSSRVLLGTPVSLSLSAGLGRRRSRRLPPWQRLSSPSSFPSATDVFGPEKRSRRCASR